MQILFFFCLSLLLPTAYAKAEATAEQTASAPVDLATQASKTLNLKNNNKKSHGRKRYISFNFDNEDLTTIINYLAAEKKINIILPAPPNSITAKVSLRHKEKLTVDEAFNLLNTVLDVAGYSIQHHGNTSIVVKNDASSIREALPVYIGIEPDNLPDTDEHIRYLYYFDNIKIPAGGSAQAQEIKTILEDMLHDPTKQGSSQVIFDSNTNSVILSGKAYSVKTAMQIVSELDKTGFREVVEVVNLLNTSAGFVARFLTDQLITPVSEGRAPNFVVGPPGSDTSFFSKTLKVIPNNRSNSLLILGRSQAVERLKDFIYKYIDIPLESGASIIHVYELQYLDAQTFAVDLAKMIKPMEVQGQSKGASLEESTFEGVIIESERPGAAETLQTKIGEVSQVALGGNRLIVAARKNQWANIKSLIEDLDKPQPQVALEVLVVDVTLDTERSLGSQIRNKHGMLPNDVNFQAANLSAPVLPVNQTNCAPIPTTVATNLLDLVCAAGQTTGPGLTNLANQSSGGSFILSFNDPSIATNGIWWVAQLLKQHTNSKIMSHPHIITLNHVQAKVALASTRIVQGPAKSNPDGTLSIQNIEIKGDLQVEILPRINLSNSINLQIAVNVNNFTTVNINNNTRNTRKVVTNATVGNGEILVIGGLVQTTESESTAETPLLGKIPILGWLFKSSDKSSIKENLMVFISPTVIKPKVGGGMTESTSAKFGLARQQSQDAEMFGQLHDPITRWFFKAPEESGVALTDHFGNNDYFSEKFIKGGEDEVKKPLPVKNPSRLDERKAARELKLKLAHEKNPLQKKVPEL